MLATPIASSAQALEENAPAAAAATLPCKNFLRCMFIDFIDRSSLFTRMSSDKVFLQDRCADRVFRIDHIAEPDAARLAEQHVGVDLVEAVVGTHPPHQFAVGDAGRVLERSGAADRHQEIFSLETWPREGPILDNVDLESNGGALLDCDAGELAVALRRMAIADIEQTALYMHGKIEDGAGRDIGQVHVAAVIVRLQ